MDMARLGWRRERDGPWAARLPRLVEIIRKHMQENADGQGMRQLQLVLAMVHGEFVPRYVDYGMLVTVALPTLILRSVCQCFGGRDYGRD